MKIVFWEQWNDISFSEFSIVNFSLKREGNMVCVSIGIMGIGIGIGFKFNS